MGVFRLTIKVEEDTKWSKRDYDLEGYFIKKRDDNHSIEGYVKYLSQPGSSLVWFIKGFYEKSSIVFLQMCNSYAVSPLCYCFPNIKENGFWSDFNYMLGFFPVYVSRPCAKGHCKISIEEITGDEKEKIASETTSIFSSQAVNSISLNQDLMEDCNSIMDFLSPKALFQMHMHCGKW